MGALCSGHSCRNETLELDSVALYRRIGIETIPNETTPFHIDRGMVVSLKGNAQLLATFRKPAAHEPISLRCMTIAEAQKPASTIATMIARPVLSIPSVSGWP